MTAPLLTGSWWGQMLAFPLGNLVKIHSGSFPARISRGSGSVWATVSGPLSKAGMIAADSDWVPDLDRPGHSCSNHHQLATWGLVLGRISPFGKEGTLLDAETDHYHQKAECAWGPSPLPLPGNAASWGGWKFTPLPGSSSGRLLEQPDPSAVR